ncbi:MAG: hypothetical protein RL219_1418 [Actinomycetota bacterium]
MRYLGLAEAFVIAKNHPLPDGNKRLAWMATVVFLELNGAELDVAEDDAVDTMLAVAAGETDETSLTECLRERIVLAPGVT